MVQKLLHFKFCQKSAKIGFCQLQARFSQLWTQITIQRKAVRLKFGPCVAFHPNKPFLSSDFIENAWFWS